MGLYLTGLVHRLLLLLVLFEVQADASCPKGWTENNGYCYMWITGDKVTRAQGQALCRTAGGDLVLPITEEEIDFVWKLYRGQNISRATLSSGSHDGLWLGCMKDDTGVWDCSRTATLQFAPWDEDSRQIEDGTCVVMWHFNGKWAKKNCYGARFGACQRRLSNCKPPQRCILVSDGNKGPGCLLNHVLGEVRATSPQQCCLACSNHLGCSSFNFWEEGVCQLNVAKRFDVAYGKIISEHPTCAYYEMDKKN